ncbi:phosphonopyruvate decarboxylase [Helicobacter jaachi]|uniref:Phosphonopyruvate decarboxylase n=1 Tax=Helicobacter jaachi TaxID=1677920 RepID=A0A4U8T5P9_9HELI|nr:thiamine pyrophosphate-dependent enzyme [Helicobacter jaachi]TLD94896.1 phosphonopyruvate decarboxylase [Helicobacter jaachi]
MIETQKFVDLMFELGLNRVSGVPCSYLSALINCCINANRFIMANNEGEAIAIASGISLCGMDSIESKNLQNLDSKKSAQNYQKDDDFYGVVLMQNSGLSNALSPLTSLNHTFKIPILCFVSLRGEPNEKGENTDEPQHELLGKITHKLLETCEIKYEFLSTNFSDAMGQLKRAKATLQSGESFVFIVRKGTFSDVPLDSVKRQGTTLSQINIDGRAAQTLKASSGWGIAKGEGATSPNSSPSPFAKEKNNNIMTKQTSFDVNLDSIESKLPSRLQALKIVQDLGKNCVILATTGKCGRELYELGDRANQLYMVGSMGCVGALGLGIALASSKKVIAIDGDSALLMRLGSLAANAYYTRNQGNFCHILLDNHSHDSTGGQDNLSPFVDFALVARACGYKNVCVAKDLSEFERALSEFIESKSDKKGAFFIYLRIAKGSKKELGRPKITPPQVAMRLAKFIESNL